MIPREKRKNLKWNTPMLKSRKAITGDGSIRIVKHRFIHVGTPGVIGDLIRCIHIAITCPLGFRIIHTLGFIGMDITVTRLTTAIIGDIIHIRTSIGGITVGAGMSPSHGELTIEATGELKIGVLEVHAV